MKVKAKPNISKKDLIILVSLLILLILSLLFLDSIKIPKSNLLNILFFPFKEIYSYISLAIAILIAFSYFNRVYKSKLKKESLTLILTIAFVFLIKFLIARQRPASGIYIGSSFPSNHAAIPFSLLAFFKNKAYWLWLILSLFISISRVYWSYHYFSDFFAGAFIGYGIGLLIKNLKLKKK